MAPWYQYEDCMKITILNLIPEVALVGFTAKCLIIKKISVMFGSKNKNKNLQFEIKLNNEAIVLDSFIQIFSIRGTYFSQFLIIPKTN
jgi:hypothetical protein